MTELTAMTELTVVEHLIDHQADPAGMAYTFGGRAPVLQVKPGTVLRTSTLDCFAGRVRSTADKASELCDPRYLNPQTGPFYVETAQPGDTLAVHFVSIEPHEAWGVSSTVPFFGALTSTPMSASLQPALAELTWIYELDLTGRLVHFAALDSPFTAALPLDPMHGTVGVAPPLGEVRSSLTPGNWGGNMDTPEMRVGTTCYLGVNVPGALFSFGDGHARQGEGETCGVAVETAMDSVVIIDVLKGLPPTPWPRLETDTHLITTGSARPLEDAFRISQLEMVHWVAELTSMSEMDSYQLVTQAVQSPVANVVDTNFTMVAKLAKSVLGGPRAMGGAHDKLASHAAAWRDSVGVGS